MSKEITIWSTESEENKKYDKSTYLRVLKVQSFVEKVQEDNKIVAVTFEDNLLGFILEDKN